MEFSLLILTNINPNISRLILRITALALVVLWTKFYVEQYIPEYGIILRTVMVGLMFALIINGGLWLSSIPFSQKKKGLTIFFLVPSLICNTILLPIFNYSFLLLSLVVGICINTLALTTLFNSNKGIPQ